MKLTIVSAHKNSFGRNMQQFGISGMPTIGVRRNEQFGVVFENTTHQPVQVKIAIDGTDILTGAPATTATNGKMWFVKPYEKLVLKAWPEDQHGGAQFVFTDVENSVAAHTHGNMAARGYISAAVFVEGAPPPISPSYMLDSLTFRGNTRGASKGISGDMMGLPGVGAGQRVNQRIEEVSGLRSPRFSEIVQVKYCWWNDLRSNPEFIALVSGATSVATAVVGEQIYANGHPTGFLAGNNWADLGTTPRLNKGGLPTTVVERKENFKEDGSRRNRKHSHVQTGISNDARFEDTNVRDLVETL